MKLFAVVSLVGLAGLLIHPPASAVPPAATPVMAPKFDPEAAIQIAQKFCSDIGRPVTIPAKALYHVPTGHAIPPDLSWRPTWRIEFPGQARLEIEDGTGTIINYMVEATWPKLDPTNTNRIGEAAAVAYAQTMLRRTGETSEVAPLFTVLRDPSYHPSWCVYWTRLQNGVPYDDETACVSVDAVTGKVDGVAIRFPTPPPPPSKVMISKETAEKLARQQFRDAGFPDAPVTDIKSGLVHPNEFWAGGDPTPQPGPAEQAWVAHFIRAGYSYSVAVNSASGAVVAGDMIGAALGGGVHGSLSLPGAAPPQSMIRIAIQGAQDVTLYSRERPGKKENAIALLKLDAASPITAAIHAAGLAAANRPPGIGEFKLGVHEQDGSTFYCGYDPQRKAIGEPDGWYQAPAPLVDWVQRVGGQNR